MELTSEDIKVLGYADVAYCKGCGLVGSMDYESCGFLEDCPRCGNVLFWLEKGFVPIKYEEW